MTLRITFEEFDKLSLRPFADRLLAFVGTEHRFVDGALVVSLEAPFGSGKSTFLEMFSNLLDSQLAETKPFALVVRLNAWESDFGDDPVLAIASGITDAISATKTKVDEGAVKKLKSAAGAVGRMLTSIGGDIVSEKLGVDIVKAGEYAQGKVPVADEAGLAVFKIYQARKKAIADLKHAVASLAEGSGMKVLLLVDELDRCRPAYAIEYLESLKHLFDDPNFTVVIGIDSRQMSSSAKSLFGSDLDFDEYFRKFAHRRIPLPSLNAGNSAAFCQSLVERYFSEEDPDHKCFAKFDRYRIENVADLFTAFGFSARQSHEVMRISAHCMRVDEGNQGRMLWGWHVATMFMAALSISSRKDYDALGRGSMPVARICEIADSLDGSKGRRSAWWKLVLLAAYIGVDKEEDVSALKNEAGIAEDDAEASRRLDKIASEGFQRWGWDRETPLSSIYSKIESLESFVR